MEPSRSIRSLQQSLHRLCQAIPLMAADAELLPPEVVTAIENLDSWVEPTYGPNFTSSMSARTKALADSTLTEEAPCGRFTMVSEAPGAGQLGQVLWRSLGHAQSESGILDSDLDLVLPERALLPEAPRYFEEFRDDDPFMDAVSTRGIYSSAPSAAPSSAAAAAASAGPPYHRPATVEDDTAFEADIQAAMKASLEEFEAHQQAPPREREKPERKKKTVDQHRKEAMRKIDPTEYTESNVEALCWLYSSYGDRLQASFPDSRLPKRDIEESFTSSRFSHPLPKWIVDLAEALYYTFRHNAAYGRGTLPWSEVASRAEAFDPSSIEEDD